MENKNVLFTETLSATFRATNAGNEYRQYDVSGKVSVSGGKVTGVSEGIAKKDAIQVASFRVGDNAGMPGVNGMGNLTIDFITSEDMPAIANDIFGFLVGAKQAASGAEEGGEA